MPRVARPVFAGIPHHVTQRGNRREPVFFSDLDRLSYLAWLRDYCHLHEVQVLAYCLMGNHIHAVVVPGADDALERVFRPLHTRYAMQINRTRQWTGHLWQGRFFSAALDEAHFRAAVRYVELNPVRAGLVRRAEDYRWSSAPAHCGQRQDRLLRDAEPWLADLAGSLSWSDWLAQGDEVAHLEALRQSSRNGLPCGSDAFVSELERRSGQVLRPQARGRPREEVAD